MAKAFKLTNDTLLLSTEAPGGIYNSAQLKKIASLCDEEGAIVKATEDQRLALFVPLAKSQEIAKQLQSTGIGIRHYQDGLHQPTTCIGALCPEHQQDAMGSALEVTENLSATKMDAVCKIGINGCSRCCVPTHTLDISVVGDSNGYRISLGGKNSQLAEMATFMAEGVPASELPRLLNKVVSIYNKQVQGDESLQEVMERCGSKAFIEALAPYSQDAHQDDDPFGAVDDLGESAEANVEESGMEEMPTEDLATDEFDSDLDPKGSLSEISGSVDIDPGEFGENDLLDDEVAINNESFATDSLGSTSAMMTSDSLGTGENLEEDFEELSSDTSASLSQDTAASEDDMQFEEDDNEASAPMEAEELALDDALTIDDQLPAKELITDDENIAADDGLPAEDLAIDDMILEDPELMQEAPQKAAAVAAAAFTQPSAADSIDDFELAEEVAEDEADAFEAKLEESIAEEESVPVEEDLNADARLEAVELLESSADDGVTEDDATGHKNFADLEIDAEMLDDSDFVETKVDFNKDDFSKADTAVTNISTSTPKSSSGKDSGSKGFAFQGFDFDDVGRFVLSFAAGASICIDPAAIIKGSRREFIACGQKIVVSHTASGLSVEIDGVALVLPQQAA